MLLFSGVTLLVTYAIERLQQVFPLNPQNLGPVSPDLAFGTASSFTTNTNWQAYGGESTMSYLTQMAGLAWHNFISVGGWHWRHVGDRARIDLPPSARRTQNDR